MGDEVLLRLVHLGVSEDEWMSQCRAAGWLGFGSSAKGWNIRLAFVLEDGIPTSWSSAGSWVMIVDGPTESIRSAGGDDLALGSSLISEGIEVTRERHTSVRPWNTTGSWPGPSEYAKVQTACADLSSYAARRLLSPVASLSIELLASDNIARDAWRVTFMAYGLHEPFPICTHTIRACRRYPSAL